MPKEPFRILNESYWFLTELLLLLPLQLPLPLLLFVFPTRPTSETDPEVASTRQPGQAFIVDLDAGLHVLDRRWRPETPER